MSIPYSGTFVRSGGVVQAIAKQARSVNLKTAKKITVKFDPFGNNVVHTRNFLYHITSPKITSLYPKCTFKTEVVCDRSEPTVEIAVDPTIHTEKIKKVIFKCGNLTCLEIFQLLNKHISAKAPPDEVLNIVQTKLEKKSAKKLTGKKK